MRGKRTSWELEGHVMPVFIIPMPARCMVCAVPRGTAMRCELCRSNMQGEFRGCRYGGRDRTRSVCMVGVLLFSARRKVGIQTTALAISRSRRGRVVRGRRRYR